MEPKLYKIHAMKRFFEKTELINRNSSLKDGCMIWTGSLDTSGYGLFRFDKRLWKAHRFMLEVIYNTPIPDGKIVLHRCDNPRCVNPAHLKTGTSEDNAKDRDVKGRSNLRTRDNTHGGSKINSRELLRGLNLFKSGYTRREVSIEWGLSYAHSCRLIKEALGE